jgi:hypothetical protein
MDLILFICKENPQLAKYCEAFYNHIHFGMSRRTSSYSNWNTSGSYKYSTTSKVGLSRLPPKTNNKNESIPMRASDTTLERIYRKVISAECYDHTYYFVTNEELRKSDMVIYLRDTSSTKLPSYLINNKTPLVSWKFSNIKKTNNQKFLLIETLIRKMINRD